MSDGLTNTEEEKLEKIREKHRDKMKASSRIDLARLERWLMLISNNMNTPQGIAADAKRFRMDLKFDKEGKRL